MPHSLLLPDHLGDPPTENAEANAALAAAIEASGKASLAVREASANYRKATHEDAPPSELRKLKQAVEDREHDFRKAKRLEAKALHTQAAAIERNGPALIEQLQPPLDELTETILTKLAEIGTQLDLQAELAGSVRTIATIDQERTQARGFEPIHATADRVQKPQAHLAALRNRAAEVRDAGHPSQQLDAPSESEGEIAA